MSTTQPIAIVGLGAILPDALNVQDFWQNLLSARYSISEVTKDRWDEALYYDSDPSVPDKTYSKIGGFVRGFRFEPLKMKLPIPPNVAAVMDEAQQWAIVASYQALQDYGYPQRSLDPERVAVIFGNSMAGEYHYRTNMRIFLPEYEQALASSEAFRQLTPEIQAAILEGFKSQIRSRIPNITEDTMPGELSNIIAGRVANLFNFSGPNFVTDAACASSFAALQAAIEGLQSYQFDAVLSGGIDRNMGVESYVKFCKIGALSPDGSRPYADGANGFVMGEGAVVFLLKRLADAEKDQDRIYAVIRGIGGSSDGKGKGITAPNPLGQQRAIERAWKNAALSPSTATLIEGHGTSTRVGDVVEVNTLNTVFSPFNLPTASIALGSVKSNIGHLKSAAGAAGLLKTVLSLYHKKLLPNANFHRPNPNLDFDRLPFYVLTTVKDWDQPKADIRRAGISSFGFGGTNFHLVVEEYLPGYALKGSSSYSGVALSVAPIQSASPAHVNAQTIPQSIPATQVQSASPSPAPQPANADIQATVLKLVAEKTGYPEDMLDLDLDLEADLGIDTVKQAELFATIRQHFGIPRREDLRLADYNTLAKVIQFMQEALSGSSPAQAPQPTAAAAISVEKATLPPSAPQASAQPRQRGLRGILFLSATDPQSLQQQCEQAINATRNGILPNQAPLSTHELSQPERLAIDYGSAEELIKRAEKALSAFENPSLWQNLTGQGIYRFSGSNKDHKVAFLFPGQGSQYANMLRDLFDVSSSVRDTYAEADAVMTPLLGKPLTDYIFCENTEEAIKAAEAELKNTIITQPAVLTANVALMRLLGEYNIHPDLVIGHSLGEYAALVAAGVLSFAEALEVVSARGREMSKVTVADNGTMAAISAPLEVVESTLKQIDGYIVIANINSPSQSVIAGETAAVASAIEAFQAAGYQAVKLSVSHAFHSKIVAPASEPLRKVIQRMHIHPPKLPIAANVTGDLYPNTVEEITDLLCQQIASPVQFIRGINTLYNHGARIFVEVGPKRVLSTLALEILKDKNDVYIFSTNHPRKGGIASFNEGLCGLYACGLPRQTAGTTIQSTQMPSIPKNTSIKYTSFPKWNGRLPLSGSVVISGAGLGLPGKAHHVFEDDNIQRLLNGEMRIDPLPEEIRREMVSLRITRLEKSESGAVMVPIESTNQVIKLAGQRGAFDLHQEFGIPQERVDALDITTQLAIAAGIEALRDAGIPLIMNFRKTSKGTYLPDRWMLPPALADETGVIFASAFPGLGGMAEELEHYYTAQQIQAQISEISSLLDLIPNDNQALRENLLNRLAELEEQSKAHPYQFNRNFIFRVLTMGHSQFAEYIGARGPNTAVNAACATTTHALAIAEDWIRAGRCRRVIVIAGDDPTSGSIAPWISGGMFASGAATTEGNLRLAALPFDRRRNGMLMGMGAAALVVEAQEALVERGMTPICEILASVIANSAFHGTRLNIDHVSQVMDRVLSEAETRYGIKRSEIAPHTVFISHETYTPARGGSASAEIRALRYTFGDQADKVMIANTKGYTGHAMGVGIEDVLATKALEYQIVPPIAHINDGFEPDPELGNLNLSRGGKADVHYALRLGAGFGSQIAMSLMRKVGTAGQRIDHPRYQKWLSNISGYPNPTLEVVQHTLRIKNEGVPPQPPADSEWQYGQVPKAWALDVPPTADAFLAHSESIPSADQSEITQHPTPQSPAATSPIEHADPTTLAEVAQHVQRALVNGSDPLSLSAYKELFEPASKLPQVSEEKRISLLAPIFKAASQAQQPPAEQSPQIEISHESEKIEEAKPEIKRRIPLPSLRPRLDLCLPTNIALNAESRIVFVGSKHKAAEALLRKLRNRKVKLLSIQTDDPQEIQTQIQAFSQEGELQGVFFLAALDTEPPLGEMDYLAWQTELDHRLYTLEAILRAIPYQPNAAHQPFLVCATAMGGAFGYDVEGARSPLGGAVVGLAKAIARERQGWFVKVIDFSPNESSNFIAEKLIAETLQDNAVIEVGWKNNMRFGITLHEQPLPSSESTVSLSLADQTPVVLVSGGSGGITVPILLDLAKTVQAHFFLLSRTPLQEDDPDLILFKQIGRNALKQTLLQRAKESGVKVKPAEIERQIDVLERKAAAQAAVEALTQAGSQVTHLVCDVSQSESVEQTVQQVLSQAARVDVLIHAAGVERSRSLETKPTEEFHQIVAIKAGGFFNLYSALLKHQALPKVMIAFGSVAGRFGNSGQTDYSAANDLLSKLCSAIRKTHNIQAVCIDWGAWAEVGMASRGVIPELMRRAGIEMMSPNAAAPLLRQELLSGCPHSEVVYSGSLGILEQQADEAYGLDLEKANTALTEGKPIYEMITRLNSFTPQDGIYLEAELDPQEYPMLRDHAIRGIPVLPGVIGIEGFRIAARHIASTLASQKGSFLAQHLEDIQFLVPFKFYHNAPRRILWKAKALLEEKGLIAYATLESTRVRPNGEVDHRLHFKGKVFLTPTKEALQPVKTQPPHWNGAYTVSSDDIYRIYFHGPAFQVLEAVQRNNGHIIGKMHQQVLDYTKNPIPYLIELCLQTAGVWEIGLRGILALPNAIDQLTIYTNKLNGKAIFAQVFPQINGDSYTFDAQAIDAEGNLLVEMKGYRTIATEMSVDSDLILPLRKLME